MATAPRRDADASPLKSTNAPRGLADVRRRLKAIFIGSIGNLVEYYDFYAYAAFALYFAKSFFPEGDELAQQLNAAVLFAAGFLARPLGGWIFGHMADRHGRRVSLTVSVALMCVGSLVIAVTPTFSSIGVWAAVILAGARILQGLSLGGEYGTSATYLSEVADEKHRGFYSSFQYVTLIGGQLCAIVVLLVLQGWLLTPLQLRAWGWRIPFAIGGLLAIVAAIMRRNLVETDSYIEVTKHKAEHRKNSLRELMHYPREVTLVIGLTMGGTAAFYTYTTYMQKFLKLSVHLSDSQTTTVTASSLIFAMLLQPIYGAISDRIGRKWLLIAFGVCGTLFTIPLLTALRATHSAMTAFLLIATAWLIVSAYTSINAVVKAELFPAAVRATGVGLPYALTVSIFGGTAESIALWCKKIGHESWFYTYLTACIAVSLLVYVFMRDTKRESLIKE
jgi:MHS family alpha-ketoglutarate permease-like MFS transporter